MSSTLLWFRRDLRLADNPALRAAVDRGGSILPLYIHDPDGEGSHRPGGASRWWLHRSLASLDASLRERGSRLIVAQGDTEAVLRSLVAETGATALYWNRRYEPAGVARDTRLKAAFAEAGVEVKSFNAGLLFEPHRVANREGRPFQVFSPYWRHCLTLDVERPVGPAPAKLPAPSSWPRSSTLDALELLPRIPWDAGLAKTWVPGEGAAQIQLKAFIRSGLESYAAERDRPDHPGTSRLSPFLHFGEIGPRQVWEAIRQSAQGSGVFPPNKGAAIFVNEIGWREFAHHLLWHFPRTPEEPLREKFAHFSWARDPGGRRLKAWQRGRTGYPIVDAGMRELWTTGWMHNRVRMIVASFLVKHLRQPWTDGAAWFWDTLVDADLAANTLNWQWSAGCGADAAPYFRIFSPMLQGAKFDPEGTYVRRWVPELGRLPVRHLQAPWEAPPAVLADAGIRLGETYPAPLVDHAVARAEALSAFQALTPKGKA